MSIEIAQATLDERKAVEVCVRACGKHVKTYFDMYYPANYYEAGEVWKAWSTEDPDTILGFAVAHLLKREHVASVYEIGVIPEAQGLGLGKRLFHAARCGRPIRIVVDHDNEQALAFYRSMGLEPKTAEPELTRSGKNLIYRIEGEPK